VWEDGCGCDVGARTGRVRRGHVGLTARRDRTELAGGWFRIDSKPGRTAITFWLPDKAGRTNA